MKRLARVTTFAGIAAAGLLALAPGLAHAAPASHTQPAVQATAPTSWTFKTRSANVRVRQAPNGTVVAKIATAGTAVTVTCYSTLSGKIWYSATKPHTGFVRGHDLVIPHPHGQKVPPGIPVCAA